MSLWQSSTWNEMLKKTNQLDKVFEVGNITTQKRSIGLGKYGLFVMGVSSLTKKEQESLVQLCKQEKTIFIQIETLSYDSTPSLKNSGHFKKGYYKKFITPYTALINLTLSEDDILAKMKPKGRYNIKLAKKKGINVKKVEKNEKNIKSYYDLSVETTSRDKFSGHSLEYYTNFLHTLENSKLFLAYKDNKVIAGGIFTFDTKVSYYYYGASSSQKQYRNLMAPYLLQWSAIEYAKSTGSKLYDFLGISGEGVDYDPTLSGVTDFKLKLTPDTLKVSESYIYINNNILYNGMVLIKKIKKRLR